MEDFDDISLALVSDDQAPVLFKIKNETKLREVFTSYAERRGQGIGSLRFRFEGKNLKIDGEETPKLLEMQDGGEIDVFWEQRGGGEDESEEPKGDKQLTIVVKNQDGDEMFFKVKRETKMGKIFDAYAQRKGIASNSLKFMLDGERIQADNTPKMLELEDQDQIDVQIDQVGGGEDSEGDGTLTLSVKDQTGAEMQFKVKKDTKLSRVMEAYASSKGVETNSLRFTIDGERIKADHTPKMLELEDGDQIDVSLDMVGGF
jgi:hypothetical protein